MKPVPEKKPINWTFALVLSLSGAGSVLAQDGAVREKVSFAVEFFKSTQGKVTTVAAPTKESLA